ncbi:CBS domain-containing protein [Sphingobacterium spiritivorum]|uniref:CBS domain-containing protein n=1 Tax=Sphingobacterium spiritivorum TaxID=258 RepID=UPI003DA38371
MYIGEILSQKFCEVSPSDTVQKGLDKIGEFHLSHLPVVSNKEYIGMINEDELLNHEDETDIIKNLKLNLAPLYLYEYQHIYDAMLYLTNYKIELLPILNKDNRYVGIITAQDVLQALNNLQSNNETGAIIVLEIGAKDNALSHIAHIIESDNASILSTAVKTLPDSSKLELTIKVNKTNISSLVATLWRFDYVVKATFNDGNGENDMQQRYDLLMNYLNI